MRAGKWMIAAGAFALLLDMGTAPLARAQAAGQAAAAQPAAGQAAGTKNYKDRDEYELYSKISQTTDPKAKLALLQTWQDKYPQSDFAADRSTLFMVTLSQLASSDPASRQKLIDKCSEILATDPDELSVRITSLRCTGLWPVELILLRPCLESRDALPKA